MPNLLLAAVLALELLEANGILQEKAARIPAVSARALHQRTLKYIPAYLVHSTNVTFAYVYVYVLLTWMCLHFRFFIC